MDNSTIKYPYFDDDSSLKLKTVTTYNNRIEYASNCRLMNGLYFVKGIDLLYDSTYNAWIIPMSTRISLGQQRTPLHEQDTVPFTSPTGDHMVFDSYQNQKVDSRKVILRSGVIGIDEKGEEIMGYFSPNPYLNCIITSTSSGRNLECMDFNILEANGYGENYSTGKYMKLSTLVPSAVRNLKQKKLAIDNSRNSYNVADNLEMFNKAKENYKNSEFPIDKEFKKAAKLLTGLTFGAEFETINGTLPPHILNKYGAIICKDGSTKNADGLYPAEFVTPPLSGSKGLQTLRNLSAEIQERCDMNINCSYHLHIGGMKITRVFMVSLFRLCYKIQNDVYKMFPYYKTNPDGIKEKNYCKKLTNIISPYCDEDFNEYINSSFVDLYTFLSGGYTMDETHNIKSKLNPWGSGGKWEIKTRYFWVNFINPIFGKSDTIEFRVHTPTLNSDKIINWLFICSAIIKFADNNTERCIKLNKISLEEVLNYYADNSKTKLGSSISQNLKQYYKERCSYFQEDLKKGDKTSPLELAQDKNFTFNAIL